MSSIPNGSMPFNNNATDGSSVPAAIWNQAMQVLVTANNDTYARIQNIVNAQSTVLVTQSTGYPAAPSTGQLLYRTDLAQLKMYNGTTWVDAQSTINATSNLFFNGVNTPGATAATANTIAIRDATAGLTVGLLTASGFTGFTIPIASGGTGSTTQNFVDLTSNQTIAGVKTFSNTVNLTPILSGEMDAGLHSIGFTELDNGASGTAITINWKNSNKQKLSISASTTLTFVPPTKPCNLALKLTYAGAFTVTLPAHKKIGGVALTFTSVNAATDILSIYWDGTSYYIMNSLNWS